MKRILLLSIALLAACVSLNAQTPLEVHGKLHVAGNRILNSAGKEPQLRGISLSWSVWQGKKYYTPEVVDWLIKDFKINLLRVSMAIQPEHGYLQDPAGQKKLVTTVIDHALSKGIYVILDWHDHNAEKHLSESKAFFKEIASKYASHPNIIYEIWNEPERQDWAVIKAYSEELIGVIREEDKDNLIIVGSPHWDQDVDVAAKDPIKGARNIAWSFHFYATESGHQDGLRLKANNAMKDGLPLFVTEWGVGEANGDGEFSLEKTRRWMDWMEDHRLSWANWNLTDKDETTALLKPGASVKGGWSKDDLTEAGIYIRAQLRKLNKVK